MRLDRVHGDDELVGDLLVRPPARDQPQRLGLAVGQLGQQQRAAVARVDAGGVPLDEPPGERREDERLAARRRCGRPAPAPPAGRASARSRWRRPAARRRRTRRARTSSRRARAAARRSGPRSRGSPRCRPCAASARPSARRRGRARGRGGRPRCRPPPRPRPRCPARSAAGCADRPARARRRRRRAGGSWPDRGGTPPANGSRRTPSGPCSSVPPTAPTRSAMPRSPRPPLSRPGTIAVPGPFTTTISRPPSPAASDRRTRSLPRRGAARW